MAKLFGYGNNSLSKSSNSDLTRMLYAFKINFQKCTFIKDERFEIGVGVLNKYDCQPIMIKKKTVKLIFMGKIFNTNEIVNSLFKAILKSIETNNEKLLVRSLRNINGVFLLVIHDSKENKIYIINDRYAMEPIYYLFDKDKLVFASEIKAIISYDSIKKIVNWDFWKDFFQYGYALGNKTPFKNIFSMPNGTILSFQKGRIRMSKYWDYDEIKINQNLNEKSAIILGVNILKKVFKRQSKDLNKSIVFLSGGFDSRCISCSLKNYTNISFENYSTNLHPSGGELDYVFAKQVSEMLGVKNIFVGRPKEMYRRYFIDHFFILDGLCTEHKWMLPLINALNKELPNFDGIGGDVLLRGPILSRNNIKQLDSKKLTLFFNKQIVIKGRREQCKLIYKVFSSPIADKLKPDNISMLKEFNKLGNIVNKVTIFYLKNRTKNAISISARHLIGRKVYSFFPFFDNEFVEYALSIPPRMKLFGHLYFEILKKAFPDVMKISTTNDITLKNQILDIHKNKLLKTSVSPRVVIDEDLQYLLHLIKTMSIPSLIDRKGLFNNVKINIEKNIDPRKYLVSVLQFCTWYNEYLPEVY